MLLLAMSDAVWYAVIALVLPLSVGLFTYLRGRDLSRIDKETLELQISHVALKEMLAFYKEELADVKKGEQECRDENKALAGELRLLTKLHGETQAEMVRLAERVAKKLGQEIAAKSEAVFDRGVETGKAVAIAEAAKNGEGK